MKTTIVEIEAGKIALSCVMLSLALLPHQVALAQDAPKDVGRVLIGLYKFGFEKGCRDRGLSKGDKGAPAFCACSIKVLETNMSQQEWQSAVFYARKRRHAEELQVFNPYLAKLQACKVKQP